MIKELVVGVFCLVMVIPGFASSDPVEPMETTSIAESGRIYEEILSSGIILNTNVESGPSSCVLDTLDQQQSMDSYYALAISEGGYYAQSFIPTLEQLTRVELKLYKKGNPIALKISIRSNLNQPDLTSQYLLGSALPSNRSWVEFDFSDIPVVPGNTYYIVWDPMGTSDPYNTTYWCVGLDNPYLNGSAWRYLMFGWEIIHNETRPYPDFCFRTYGLASINNPPDKPKTPEGDSAGKVGVSYIYAASTTDMDGDQIFYLFDWDDGTNSGWLGPYASGDTCDKSHMWNSTGSYSIKVKARDTHGAESIWSDPLPITMPYSYSLIDQFLDWLCQRFPHIFLLFHQ